MTSPAVLARALRKLLGRVPDLADLWTEDGPTAAALEAQLYTPGDR